MILLSSPSSPFVRKIRIAAHLLGLVDKITEKVTNTQDPDPDFHTQNPLGKIPSLILEDGTALYDSPVILEYMDSLTTTSTIYIKDGIERYKDLTLAALADGLMDANILRVYEGRYRSKEMQLQSWLDFQGGKVDRGLAALEKSPPSLEGPTTIGLITLACSLGYLDFRFNGEWRKDHPNLVAWLDAFAAKVPAFAETAPPKA